ncbi:MAG: zinc ribbon domain-containing protein [bacterium]|nr:zinc ribbon domain-containing protein [bacterium]
MSIQNETDQRAKIQSLTQSLSEMETALTEHYCDIGKSLLEIAEKEDKEINQLADKIIETRKQLALLQKEIQCPECLTYNSAGSRYCSNCGKRLA